MQDWAENNDLPTTAENLFRISGANVTFQDLSLHDGKDVDWFRFSIGTTGQTNDKISTATTGSNSLRTEIYNSSGNTLLRSSIGGSDNSASLNGLSSGDYLLKVSSPTNTIVRKYSIVANGPTASQATSRLGDISSQGKAYPVGGVANQLALTGLELAPTADNWFAIDTPRLSEKRWFSVQVSQASGGSLKATILDALGKPISSDQGSDTLVLGYQAVGASERYYLRVTNEKATVASYNLQINNLVETFSDVIVQERLSGVLIDKLPLSEVVANVGNVTIKDERFEWVSGSLRLRSGFHLSAIEQADVFIPIVVDNAQNANSPLEFVLPIKVIENTRPYYNQAYPENVNNDFDNTGAPVISPLDALIIINYLNGRSPLNINVRDAGIGVTPYFVDVSGDGLLSPRDALLVINKINKLKAGGEGESIERDSPEPEAAMNISRNESVDQVFFSWSETELEQLTKRRNWK